MALAPVPITATRLPRGRRRGPTPRNGKRGLGNRRVLRCRDRRGMCSPPAPEMRNCATYSCPVVGEHMPAVLVVIPVRSVDVRVEPDVAAQPVLLGDAPEVIQDLRLWREQFAPGRLGLERERVQVRRDVAGAARIGVVPPGAAYVVGLLQDQEVDALALQRDAHAKTGEAGADDQRAGVHGLLGAAFGSLLGQPSSIGVLPGNAGTGYFGSQVNRLSLHSQRC